MPNDFSLFELEDSPEYQKLSPEDQKQTTDGYISEYGNDQAVSWLGELEDSEEYQSLSFDDQQTISNDYRNKYSIDPPEYDSENPFKQGFTAMKSSSTYAKDMAMRDFGSAAQTIHDIVLYNEQNPASEASQELSAAWEGGEGVFDATGDVVDEVLNDFNEAPTIWGGIKSLWDNASAMGAGIAKQTPSMIPPMALMATGAAAGSTLGPGGTIAGGFAGASAGNAMVEGQGIAIDELQKAGINPKDKESVSRFLEENYSSLFGKAAGKGAIIGAVDTATMGISHFLLSGPGKLATKKALAEMSVDLTKKSAVKEAMRSEEFGRKILANKSFQATQKGLNKKARNTLAATLEPAGEFTGEYAGSGIALDDWDAKNATLEAFSSLGTSGITFAGQKAIESSIKPFQSKKEEAIPEVPVEDIASTVSTISEDASTEEVLEQIETIASQSQLKPEDLVDDRLGKLGDIDIDMLDKIAEAGKLDTLLSPVQETRTVEDIIAKKKIGISPEGVGLDERGAVLTEGETDVFGKTEPQKSGPQKIREQFAGIAKRKEAYQSKLDAYEAKNKQRLDDIRSGDIDVADLSGEELELFYEEKSIRDEETKARKDFGDGEKVERLVGFAKPVTAEKQMFKEDKEEMVQANPYKDEMDNIVSSGRISYSSAIDNGLDKESIEKINKNNPGLISKEGKIDLDEYATGTEVYSGTSDLIQKWKVVAAEQEKIAKVSEQSPADFKILIDNVKADPDYISDEDIEGLGSLSLDQKTKLLEAKHPEAKKEKKKDEKEILPDHVGDAGRDEKDKRPTLRRKRMQKEAVKDRETVGPPTEKAVTPDKPKVDAVDGKTVSAGVEEKKTEPVEEIDNTDSVAHGQEVNTSPSEAQKEAENYKMAHVRHDGLEFSIENPAGTTRSGKDKDGESWAIEMKNDYGRIKGTEGYDKDHIDVFFAKGYEGGAENVHIVNQHNKDGSFDEHKVVIGAKSRVDAKRTYNANYEKGWKGGKNVVEMPMDDFKVWVKSDEPKQGPAEQVADIKELVTSETTKTAELELYEMTYPEVIGKVKKAEHKKAIVKAMSEGKQVSDRVLLSYPELKQEDTPQEVEVTYNKEDAEFHGLIGQKRGQLLKDAKKVGIKYKAGQKGLTSDVIIRDILKAVNEAKFSKTSAMFAQDKQADIKQEIEEKLGKEGLSNLTKKGVLEIVTPEQANEILSDEPGTKQSRDRSIEGFFLDGKTYLVQGNIAKGNSYDVLMHEVAIHLERLGFKESKQFKQVLSMVKRRAKKDTAEGRAIREAQSRVPEDTRPEHIDEEVLAYLTANSPEISIVRALIARIKKFLIEKMGLTAKSLKVIDLQALATSVLKKEAKTSGIKQRSDVQLKYGKKYDKDTEKEFALSVGSFEGKTEHQRKKEKELEEAGFFAEYSEGSKDRDAKIRSLQPLDISDRGRTTSRRESVENFKRWFGDSLAVDKDGNPMVWFHGSPTFGRAGEKSWTFDPSRKGENVGHTFTGFGTTFTANFTEAEFATRDEDNVDPLAFHIRMENPYILTEKDIKNLQRYFEDEGKLAKTEAFAKRKMELGGHDAIYNPKTGFIYLADSNQSKSISNTGLYGETGDVRYSIASSPFTGAKEKIDTLINEASPKWQDRIERFVYHALDKDDPRKRVYQTGSIKTAKNDILTVERLRGKKTADEVATFMREKVDPLLKHLADNNLNQSDLEEYAYSLHVPERNLQMQRVNSKRYLDMLFRQMGKKDSDRWEGEMDKIKEEAEFNDWDLSEKHDAFLGLMQDVFASHDIRQKEIDDRQQELDNTTWTKAQIDKGTPEFHQKRLDNKKEKLERSKEIEADWEERSPRFAGITDQEAQSITNRWKKSGKLKAIDSAQKMLAEINQLRLKTLRDSGELSQREYDATSDLYDNYVPLYRDGFDDNVPATGRVLGPLGKPLKVAKGSMREVVNILANSVQNYQTAINRKHKALAGKTLFNFVEQNPDSGITIESPPAKPTHDKEGNLVMYPDPVEPDNGIFIKIDGKRHTLIFDTDSRTQQGRTLARFLDNVKNSSGNLGVIMRTLTRINRFLSSINTMWSPEFILSNFVRDIQTAGVHLEDTDAKGMQKDIIKDIFPAIKGIFKAERGDDKTEMGKWYRDFSRNGGKIGWLQGYEGITDLAKELESSMKLHQEGHTVRKSLKRIKDLVEHSNVAVENGVRLAVYKNLVESGTSKEKAALAASNLTVDFTRRGTAGPALNALYMFANAGIQGNVRMIKAMKNSSKVRKIVGGIVGTGFAMHFLALAMGGDDETGEPYIDGVEDFHKERNMIIMLPGTKGDYIKIPMPYGYNVFYNIGSEVADMISKKSSDREYKTSQGAMRIMNSIMGSFNPLAGGTVLQTLAPTVADPVVQAYEEKTYSGKDLMPSQSPFGPKKPDSERYWASVSAPSKVIAKTLNKITGGDEFEGGVIDISPETLDLMYDHVTGSAGRFLKNIGLAAPRAMSEEGLTTAQTPVLRRFAGEQSTYKINSKYRDKKNELELFELRFDNAKTVKERRTLAKDPKYREMRIIEKFDKDISKLKKKVRAYELAEKKDAVRKLNERIKLLQTKFLQSINKKSMKQQ